MKDQRSDREIKDIEGYFSLLNKTVLVRDKQDKETAGSYMTRGADFPHQSSHQMYLFQNLLQSLVQVDNNSLFYLFKTPFFFSSSARVRGSITFIRASL